MEAKREGGDKKKEGQRGGTEHPPPTPAHLERILEFDVVGDADLVEELVNPRPVGLDECVELDGCKRLS